MSRRIASTAMADTRSGIAEAGVVHQDVDLSERIQSLGCEPLAVRG